jgi:chlorobactene glucosyltransferase
MGLRWRRSGRRLLWGYAAAATAFYAAVWLRTRTGEDRAGGAEGRPQAREEKHPLPSVSIVVPARNEERNIRDCVESLLAQDYPNYRVIVVDDQSTDQTSEILDVTRRTHPSGSLLTVLRASELPPGWAGKPHALHLGASSSTGEWLLFTDADTRHAPGALRYAVERTLRDGADLLSLATTQDLPDLWGRVLMPMAFMGISMMYPSRRVNDPGSSVAIANGQYILIRRSVYDYVGGYDSARLRASIVDDRDLAREVKRSGGRLEVVDGRGLVRTRMYRSLPEHWDGWTKNAYVGSRGGPAFYILMLVGLPLSCILPFALLFGGALARRRDWLLAGALPSAAALIYRRWLDRRLGVPARYAWTHPLAAAVFTGILARSCWRVITGRGVEWRGRTIRAANGD